MKATIITVGTELLFGKTADTNSAYISAELQNLGVDVLYRHTVGDNPERLKKMLAVSFEDCDLVITTGGLGPTQDDLTKEIAAEFMGDELVMHEESLEGIEAFFRRIGRPMTVNNKKQAMMPSRAIVFENSQGTAPGFALVLTGKTSASDFALASIDKAKLSDLVKTSSKEKSITELAPNSPEKTIICLPGPPREMQAMFRSHVAPFLASKTEGTIYYRILRTFNIGESMLETALMDLIENQTDPTIATYAKEGECTLRIASKHRDIEKARAAVFAMRDIVMDRIGEYVFSDDNEDLHYIVGRELLKRNISISCAESCTGGMFAAKLTDVPGISAVFDRGFVTYSNEAKVKELNVPIEIIETYGAVSEETATAMAKGLKDKTGSRLAISVTGIAGPDGGSADKPVGLVYICCAFDDKLVVKRIQGRNTNRYWNRNYAVLNMFHIIWTLLKEADET
jgi:nicotinamide-nucleotide amidase